MENTSNNSEIEKRAKIIVFAILFANFFRNLGISIIEIGLPLFVLSLAGTVTSYGIIMGIFSVTQAIFQFPMARVSDKVGRKKMVLLGTFVYIIGTFLCYLAQTILELIIYRAIQGAGAYTSILMAMISDYYRNEKKYGKSMGIFSFSMTLGFFGGIIIGGYISNYLGFRMIFIFSTILGIFSALLIMFFIRETEITYKTNSFNENNNNIQIERLKKNELKILLKDKQFNALVLLNSLRWLLFTGIYIYYIWVIQIHFALSQLEATYLLIFVTFVYMFFIIFGGYLSDKYGAKKILLFSQLIIISFGLIVYISIELMVFIILGVFTGIGFALFQTSGYSLLAQYVNQKYPDLKGSGFGYSDTTGFICGFIGTTLICWLGEISTFLPYYLVSFMVIITLYISFKYIKELEGLKLTTNAI
jgi:MFS family permease